MAAGQDTSILESGEGVKGVDRAALEKEVRDKAQKAREEELRKRGEQARRADYLTRALREAERAKVVALTSAQIADDSNYIATASAAVVAKAEARHTAAMAVKARLVRMLPYAAGYEADVIERRRKAGEAEWVSFILCYFFFLNYFTCCCAVLSE